MMRDSQVYPAQPSKIKLRLNVLLAINPVVGVVSFKIYKENTDAPLFAQYITDDLLPKLPRGVRHTILWDNLSSHFTDRTAINAIEAQRHRVVARPSYSPDMAPIESAFAKLKAFLRAHRARITTRNLHVAIQMAILSITAHDCQGWYAHCHYYVPGREFKPYLGAQ